MMLIAVCVLAFLQTNIECSPTIEGEKHVNLQESFPVPEYEMVASFGHSTACGIIQKGNVNTLVGGDLVENATYPWFVVIHRHGSNMNSGFTGALISDRHVVTAAHCFDRYTPLEKLWQATLGTKNTGCRADSTIETYNIAKIVVHEEYMTLSTLFDIALITLDGTTKHTPICLPRPNVVVTGEKKGHVVGLGSLNEKTQGSMCEMNEIISDIFTPSECTKSIIPHDIAASEITFCAGTMAGGVEACVEDSGAPLSVIFEGRFTLQGIVSFGYGCAKKRYPGIYTNVPSYVEWIRNASLYG